MGLRKEKEGKSSERTLTGEAGLAYHVFSEAPLADQELFQSDMKLKQLTDQLIRKSSELERLRDYVTKLEEGENSLIRELTRQLATKDGEISRIAALYAKKEAENRKLSTAFEAHIISEKENAERIRALLLRKEQDTVSSTEQLRKELERKDAEVTSLRNSLIQTRQVSRAELPDNSVYLKQIQHLQKKLQDRETEANRLERGFLEEQKLNKSAQSRLKEQIASTASQLEELKSFLIEKENLVQNLEAAFEKRLAAKDEELRRLKTAIEHKPATGLHREADRLRSELQVKEEASKMMAEEMAKLKEQSALIRRRLEERQRVFFESERAYEELIAKLREQHDMRVRQLVNEASQKEAALASALEEEKSKLKRETALIREKEKQIDETLQAFTTTSERLIKLGSAGQSAEGAIGVEVEAMHERQKQLEEKSKYLESKESELKIMLSATEARIAELKAKEAETERKEQLLLQEQQAINRELDVLSNAGIEIGKSRQYLQQKLEQISSIPLPVSSQSLQPQPPQTVGYLAQQEAQQPKPQPAPWPAPHKAEQQETELGFTQSQGVQEAQEEEQLKTPRFSGISSAPTEVQEAVTELADEGGMAEAAKTATTTKAAIIQKQEVKSAAASKIKPIKLTKTQQRQLAKKAKLEAKRQLRQKLTVKPPQLQKQTAPSATPSKPSQIAAPKEMAIGAREADGHTGQELFTELGGYSEVDEIKSIVEVGLQHGDSLEQIRESLLVSGYSKQNIEKALSGIKK